MVDITPLEAFELLDNTMASLNNNYYLKPNYLFKYLYYYYLSPTELLMIKRFNRKSLIQLLAKIEYYYKKAIVSPG